MAGTVSEDMDESEFIESVWERAMFEGDLKYRQMNGEDPDVEAEMLDFKTQQERKQQTMLKMAKQDLQDVLDEENLGGVDDNVDTDWIRKWFFWSLFGKMESLNSLKKILVYARRSGLIYADRIIIACCS